MEWEGHEPRTGEMHTISWKTWRKRPVGGPRRGWGANIRMGLKEIRWEDMNWGHLAQIGTTGGVLWTR